MDGAIAQLGERLLCKQEVVGSIPSGSTTKVVVLPASSIAAAGSRSVRMQYRNSCPPFLMAVHVLSDIVKRRFVRGSARDLAHGPADLNRCGRAKLEET